MPGTVTVSWTASPDEKRDDRLHYMVTQRDSSKRQWHTVADHIFNNRFTACNIMPGREYQFRVYAKNDMGSSKHSESPKWLITAKKGMEMQTQALANTVLTYYPHITTLLHYRVLRLPADLNCLCTFFPCVSLLNQLIQCIQ